MRKRRLGEAKQLTANHEAGKWLSLSLALYIIQLFMVLSLLRNWASFPGTVRYVRVDMEQLVSICNRVGILLQACLKLPHKGLMGCSLLWVLRPG